MTFFEIWTDRNSKAKPLESCSIESNEQIKSMVVDLFEDKVTLNMYNGFEDVPFIIGDKLQAKKICDILTEFITSGV